MGVCCGVQRRAPGATEVWAGPLADGGTVLLLSNRNVTGAASITASWADIGLGPADRVKVRDYHSHADLGTFEGQFTAEAEEHGVRAFLLEACLSPEQQQRGMAAAGF